MNKAHSSSSVTYTRSGTQDRRVGTLHKNWCQVWGLVVDHLRRTIATVSSYREFVLAGHPSDTAQQHLLGLLGARRSQGTEERTLSAADGSCIALAAVGESSAQLPNVLPAG